jgi:CHAD domain-containing protein
MPYRFKHRESVQDGLRRIAAEQIDRALAELGDDSLDPAVAVHQVRKRLKKLRGLLRLVRPAIGGKTSKHSNHRFRDLGRALSGARDAEVMIATFDALRSRLDKDSDSERFNAFRDALVQQRDRRIADGAGDLDARMAGVADGLRDVRGQLDDWQLDGDEFDALGGGLTRSYRQGRKAMRGARRERRDAPFHDWRKRVKDQWYHTRLLQSTWPAAMKTRRRELKKLESLLGDAQDLAALRAGLNAPPGTTLGDSLKQRLETVIDERQRQLRRQAVALGRRVYAEKPGCLRKRLGACWSAWR